MAWTSGTATDAEDFFTKLVSFLQTDSDLVSAGQEWTTAWSGTGTYANDLVLEGPGLSGSDEVFVGLRLELNSGSDTYALTINGMTGVLESAGTIFEHVNVSNGVRIYLDDNPFAYWFVANGRRFIIVCRISTVYEAAYAGLYLPYSFPTTYPYPLFIGGSAPGNSFFSDTWRSTSGAHSHFSNPVAYGAPFNLDPPAYFIDPTGTWIPVVNDGNDMGGVANAGMGPNNMGEGFGTGRGGGYSRFGYSWLLGNLDSCYGDGMALMPFTIMQRTGSYITYGILDGAYKCQGRNNGAENIIQIDGVDHLVVQNAFRTGGNDYWAMRLS